MNLSAATLAVVLALGGGVAIAKGGGGGGGGGGTGSPPPSSGTWPAAYPLPTSPGTIISQSSTTAVVRSTDSTGVVNSKLDTLYVTQKGCTEKLAVNRPKDYLCFNSATGKTDEIYFTFAALDPTATDPSRSQTNAFLLKG
ncbi:MAG TPA: hypothetical protein VGC84_15415 [Ilumatobacteraceae bacterium]|jgi:hypothetical protein